MRRAFTAVAFALLGHKSALAENDPSHALTMMVPFPRGRGDGTFGGYFGARASE